MDTTRKMPYWSSKTTKMVAEELEHLDSDLLFYLCREPRYRCSTVRHESYIYSLVFSQHIEHYYLEGIGGNHLGEKIIHHFDTEAYPPRPNGDQNPDGVQFFALGDLLALLPTTANQRRHKLKLLLED